METQTSPILPQSPAGQTGQHFIFPSASELFSQARKIYKEKFNSIIVIAFCSTIAGTIPSLIKSLTRNYLSSPSVPNKAPLMALAVLVYLLAIYIAIWSFAALIRNIQSPDNNTPAGKSFSEASHDIWPLLLTGVLYFLAILGGTILLVVPGIIFALWFGQSMYITVTENLSGQEAMKKSKFYVKGNIGQILAKILYMLLISFLAIIAVAIISGILDGITRANIFTSAGMSLFDLFWSPLATIYAFLLFQNLRQSKAHLSQN